MHPVRTTVSENGPSNNRPPKVPGIYEKFKKVKESTQRPTARPVVDKEGRPSIMQVKHEPKPHKVYFGRLALAIKYISKWWKKEDNRTIAQDDCWDKKEKELPSKSGSLFQGLFWRGSDTSEANVHGASEPHMTKPKGTCAKCHLVLLSLSISGSQYSLITIVKLKYNLSI